MKLWQRFADRWTHLVFRDRYKDITPKIRVLRILEEAMELAQAEHITEDEVDIIKRQVYDKPIGIPKQELGGVLVCLAGYAATADMDLETCFFDEFERIMDPEIMEKVRKRNLEGDKIGFDKTPNNTEDSPVPPHGFDLMGHYWDPYEDKLVWLPIEEFKNEVDGYTTEVLVNQEIITGRYHCGYTWGWANAENEKIIFPSHFKGAPQPKLYAIPGAEELRNKALNLYVRIRSADEPLRSFDPEIHDILGPKDPPYNATTLTLRNGKPSCPNFISNVQYTLEYLKPDQCVTTFATMEDGWMATVYDSETADTYKEKSYNIASALVLALLQRYIDQKSR